MGLFDTIKITKFVQLNRAQNLFPELQGPETRDWVKTGWTGKSILRILVLLSTKMPGERPAMRDSPFFMGFHTVCKFGITERCLFC